MLSEELKSIHAALGILLGKLDVDNADLLRQCRKNLEAAEDMAANMERNFCPQEVA